VIQVEAPDDPGTPQSQPVWVRPTIGQVTATKNVPNNLGADGLTCTPRAHHGFINGPVRDAGHEIQNGTGSHMVD
jgi:hypothetical protein